MQGMVIYCERVGDGLWAEPLNALTNVAFFVAGIAAARFYQWRLGGAARTHWDLLLLIGLLFAIGVGSGLWHTLATPWSAWADVIPILAFMNLFLVVFLYRAAGLGTVSVAIGLFLFQWSMVTAGSLFPAGALNGSMFYVPSLAVLVLMAGYAVFRYGRAAWPLPVAAGLFMVSLGLRSVDMDWCPRFPWGVHFVWHLINAGVLYLVLRGLMAAYSLRRDARL